MFSALLPQTESWHHQTVETSFLTGVGVGVKPGGQWFISYPKITLNGDKSAPFFSCTTDGWTPRAGLVLKCEILSAPEFKKTSREWRVRRAAPQFGMNVQLTGVSVSSLLSCGRPRRRGAPIRHQGHEGRKYVHLCAQVSARSFSPWNVLTFRVFFPLFVIVVGRYPGAQLGAGENLHHGVGADGFWRRHRWIVSFSQQATELSDWGGELAWDPADTQTREFTVQQDELIQSIGKKNRC